MPTDPLTGSRYPAPSAVPNVAQDLQNAVFDLADNTIPRFTTTTARDSAYASWVTAGGTMADGMLCSVNGVPYRRIAGTWRINRPRTFVRSVVVNGGAGNTIASGGGNQSGVTTGVPALTSFTLWEASRIAIQAVFRTGVDVEGVGVAFCQIMINGSPAGNATMQRYRDMSTPYIASLDLAAGTHSIAARVDATAGSVTWIRTDITISETATE